IMILMLCLIRRRRWERLMRYDLAANTHASEVSPIFADAYRGTTITAAPPAGTTELQVPHYLNAYYWWAYIHPRAVRVFERQWLVNLILWGSYARLRDAVLAEMGDALPGRTLQVACVYGDLTSRLSARVTLDGQMDVVDVLPIQLSNLCRKLPRNAPVRLL